MAPRKKKATPENADIEKLESSDPQLNILPKSGPDPIPVTPQRTESAEEPKDSDYAEPISTGEGAEGRPEEEKAPDKPQAPDGKECDGEEIPEGALEEEMTPESKVPEDTPEKAEMPLPDSPEAEADEEAVLPLQPAEEEAAKEIDGIPEEYAEKEVPVRALPTPPAINDAEKDEGTDGKDAKEYRTKIINSVFDFIELFIFTLVGVLIITSFFLRQSVVEGDSMLGTLKNGDNLLISDFLYDPTPGDIIVCEDYSTALRKPIVKRVIATEGQTVRITEDGVYVDGILLIEPYVFTDFPGYNYDVSTAPVVFRIDAQRYQLLYSEHEYYQITVPEGELFVMGDHRNNSTDSRVIGTVTEDSVIGKVLLRFYPFDDFGIIN